MKLILSTLLFALVSCAPPKRRTEAQSRTARFITIMHDLGATTPVPATPEVDRALTTALVSLVDDAPELSRRYAENLNEGERRRLSERLPALIARQSEGEPYLQIALQKLRRSFDVHAPRRSLAVTARDYYQIARAKLWPRPFTSPTFEEATVRADLLLRLEDLVSRGTAPAPRPLTPTDELLEYLVDLRSSEPSAISIQYLAEKLDEVGDLDQFERTYREKVEYPIRVQLAERATDLSHALAARESAAVLAKLKMLRAQKLALTREMQLVRGLTNEIFRSFGGMLQRRIGISSAGRRFARSERIDARALHLLRFERLVQGGAELSCQDQLARALSSRPD